MLGPRENEGITPIQMKKYYLVLLLCALLLNENLVEWAVAMVVGGHTFTSGFQRAFDCWSIGGYLFFTALRSIPYLGLGLALFAVSKINRDYFMAVFAGGFVGIVSILLLGSWEALRPGYAGERISSTTAIDFVILPILASAAGFVGVLIGIGIQAFLRRGRQPGN